MGLQKRALAESAACMTGRRKMASGRGLSSIWKCEMNRVDFCPNDLTSQNAKYCLLVVVSDAIQGELYSRTTQPEAGRSQALLCSSSA